MLICTYTHIYIHMYIHMYTHSLWVYVYIYRYIHMSHIYVFAYTHLQMYTYTFWVYVGSCGLPITRRFYFRRPDGEVWSQAGGVQRAVELLLQTAARSGGHELPTLLAAAQAFFWVDHIKIRILHKHKDPRSPRKIPEAMVCRILISISSFEPLFLARRLLMNGRVLSRLPEEG